MNVNLDHSRIIDDCSKLRSNVLLQNWFENEAYKVLPELDQETSTYAVYDMLQIICYIICNICLMGHYMYVYFMNGNRGIPNYFWSEI